MTSYAVPAGVLALLWAHALSGHPEPPVLAYDKPQNFYRSAITPPEDYSSTEFNAGLQIYPFQPFRGDIERAFRQTLLPDRIDPRYRESAVTAQPQFRATQVSGAEFAATAFFQDGVRYRVRTLVVASGHFALVDIYAGNFGLYQRMLPALNALGASLRVEAAGRAARYDDPPASPANAEIAGLYVGTKAKYMVNLMRGVGSGNWVTAMHYYLLSPGGRVYRAYDGIPFPGEDIRRFNFDAAQRNDPVNSGRWVVSGNTIRMQLDGGTEVITAPAPQNGRMTVNSVLYVRQ